MAPCLTVVVAQQAASGGATSLMVDLLLTLAAAAAVTIVFKRFGLSTIPGYLITGAIIGPSALALISSAENVQAISGLAILLLMFTIGLQLDFAGIRSGMVSILSIGLGSTLATWAVGIPVGMAFGFSAPAALVLGMAMSMSSTAVAMGVLQQRREVNRVQGRLCIGVSVTQDLLSIAILALMPPIAVWAGGQSAGSAPGLVTGLSGGPLADLLVSGVVAMLAVGLMIIIGRHALPKLLREAARGGASETLLVVASAVAFAAAALTTYVGIGPALGAFLAGFMLATTPFRHQLAGQLAPLRELFMAVFFTVVGLNMNVPAVMDAWWLVPIGLATLFAVKGTIIALSTWAGGANAATSLQTGALLTQAGEFSLVVLAAAAMSGVIPAEQQPLIIAVVVLSLIVTPWCYDVAKLAAPALARFPAAPWVRSGALVDRAPTPGTGGAEAEGATAPTAGGVIIAGFGLVGRAVADRLKIAGIPYTIVELNPGTVRKQGSLGRAIVYGDISNPEVLESAGIRTAAAIVITIPDDDAILLACQAIRAISPSIFIAVRTSFLSNAFLATNAGADHVTVAEVATAEAMAKQVMQQLEKRNAATSGAARP